MPIYEYICEGCNDQFELIQGFSDKPVKKCPKCGGKVRKLVSECAFQLKGTGWYITDYAKKSGASPKNPKKNEPRAEPQGPTKTETKSESTTKDTSASAGTTPKSSEPASTTSK
jgi:putative FmdB family regulatory protein